MSVMKIYYFHLFLYCKVCEGLCNLVLPSICLYVTEMYPCFSVVLHISFTRLYQSSFIHSSVIGQMVSRCLAPQIPELLPGSVG